MSVQVLVDMGRTFFSRSLPHGVSGWQGIEYIFHASTSLTTLLHPLLANLLQVEGWWIHLSAFARFGNVSCIPVRAAWTQADDDAIGRHGCNLCVGLEGKGTCQAFQTGSQARQVSTTAQLIDAKEQVQMESRHEKAREVGKWDGGCLLDTTRDEKVAVKRGCLRFLVKVKVSLATRSRREAMSAHQDNMSPKVVGMVVGVVVGVVVAVMVGWRRQANWFTGLMRGLGGAGLQDANAGTDRSFIICLLTRVRLLNCLSTAQCLAMERVDAAP